MTDSQDILGADMPHLFARMHRIDEMDVGGRQPGGMGPGEAPVVDSFQVCSGKNNSGAAAEMDGRRKSTAEDVDAETEKLRLLIDHHQWIGCQRIGVHGRYKERRGHGSGGRDPAEWSCSQTAPEP